MKLETLKTKLGEWFWPRSTAVEDLMAEILTASKDLKKDLKEDLHRTLSKQIITYHYCAKQSLKLVSGIVVVHTHTEYDNGVRKYTTYELYQSIRESIAWQNSFNLDKMVILSLSTFN